MLRLVVVTALVAPSAQSSCRIDICSYEGFGCCTPMGEARSCDVPGYLVADGGPSWCAEIFGESAAYQCCREETEESGSGLDAQSCPITRESCYNDPVPGDCSWICEDIFSRFSEFKGMDLDSDGVVTIEEMEEVRYNWASPAEAKEMAQREMRPMDRDGDNALSEEEFMHSGHHLGALGGFTWAMDLNGDGVVTTEEMEEAQYNANDFLVINPAHIKEWAEREMQWVDRDGDNAISKEDCPINREFCENDPLLPDDCSCGRVDEGHGHVYYDSAVADCGYRACGYCDCAFEKYYGDGRCCSYEDAYNMEPSAEDIRKWTDRDLNGDGVATMEEIEEMHNHANDWDWMPSPADEVKCRDRDGDNAISKEEWMHQKEGNGWSHMLYEHLVGDRNSWDAHGNEIVLDANGDGFVTIEEIVVILMREGHGSRGPRLKEWAEQEMQWADMDGDNAITKEEWWSPDGCHNDHDHDAWVEHGSGMGSGAESEDFNQPSADAWLFGCSSSCTSPDGQGGTDCYAGPHGEACSCSSGSAYPVGTFELLGLGLYTRYTCCVAESGLPTQGDSCEYSGINAPPTPAAPPPPSPPPWPSSCAPGCDWEDPHLGIHSMPIGYGDGICDDECNNADCGYDGGDCGPGEEGSGTEECAPGCEGGWPGDEICDDECNNAECNFDGGDCTPRLSPPPGHRRRGRRRRRASHASAARVATILPSLAPGSAPRTAPARQLRRGPCHSFPSTRNRLAASTCTTSTIALARGVPQRPSAASGATTRWSRRSSGAKESWETTAAPPRWLRSRTRPTEPA